MKLTGKQCRFVDAYLDCGNGAEAARRAGYAARPKQQAYENLRKPQIRVAILERMDKAGLTEERLLKLLYEGLGATIIKVFNHDGKILLSDPFVDYPTRHKYIETALRLRSMFPAEKHEVTQRTISDEEYRASLDRIERMLEKNRNN